MARPQAAQDAPRRRGLAALPLLLGALILGACSSQFRLSGQITMSSPVQRRPPMINGVLFIIAKNRGGVPLAVKRIVNPQFPVDFTMVGDDLVVPGAQISEPLTLEVEMNTHGNVGKPVKGDLEGTYPDVVYSGDRGVHLVIDRVHP